MLVEHLHGDRYWSELARQSKGWTREGGVSFGSLCPSTSFEARDGRGHVELQATGGGPRRVLSGGSRLNQIAHRTRNVRIPRDVVGLVVRHCEAAVDRVHRQAGVGVAAHQRDHQLVVRGGGDTARLDCVRVRLTGIGEAVLLIEWRRCAAREGLDENAWAAGGGGAERVRRAGCRGVAVEESDRRLVAVDRVDRQTSPGITERIGDRWGGREGRDSDHDEVCACGIDPRCGDLILIAGSRSGVRDERESASPAAGRERRADPRHALSPSAETETQS